MLQRSCLPSYLAGHFIAWQSGAVLLSTLVLIMVLMLLGRSVIHQSIWNEKITLNYREYTRAFFAAEAALKSAEDFILSVDSIADLNTITRDPSQTSSENAALTCPDAWWSGDTADCDGLAGSTQAVATRFDPRDESTGQAGFAIEHIGFSPNSLNQGGDSRDGQGVHHFRVVSRGTGQVRDDNGQPITVVFLQSIYSRAF